MMRKSLKRLVKNPMLAVMAAAAILYGGTKGVVSGTITFDELLVDQGSSLTNDTVHISAAKATALLPDTAEMLVHARELGSTNAADWVELLPRRTVGELPCDYVLQNATNHNVTVTVDWQPSQSVVTNFQLTVPGLAAMETTPFPGLDAVLRGTVLEAADGEREDNQ